jgi:hypothetical protein
VKGLGLIDMIRSVALSEIRDDEGATEWLDTHYNHRAVTGMLLAPALEKKWGVPNEWVVERFVFGDLSVDETVADLEEFTGREGLAAEVGGLATALASDIVRRWRRESLGQ